jgi:flagellar hook-basal body complex protein FliE
MDPLSALKMISPGELAQLGQSAQDAGAVKTIGAAQIEKLAPGLTLPAPGQAPAVGSFESMLGGFVNEVAQKQSTANTTVNSLLSGQNVPLHQAMISVEEASVSFQLMVEVRNRLLDSYQELMKMQV